jgi:hypothetical protein
VDVKPEVQRATFERVFEQGRRIAADGKIPVIVVDHRLTGLDDRPIIKKGLEDFAQRNGVKELRDVNAALQDGTLKFLPGYTEQASDHWRAEHQELISKYPPGTFGAPGTRLDIRFMGYSAREANATAGLSELESEWKRATGGKGEIIFAGAGTGSAEDFASVYRRPVEQGGAGLQNPDVRHGSPQPSEAANTRASQLAAAYTAQHTSEPAVRLDQDSRGKAGWVETIERERGPAGEEKVVAAFIDDRAHNRIGVTGAATLGEQVIAIKSVAPGLSYSQNDNGNVNVISTFDPTPD